MKNYWIQTFRRLGAATIVAGTSMFYSAMCYASAFDIATNPPYADGWQAGDNGGTGFTPWNFDGSDAAAIHGIDSSSPFNNIGTAWRLASTSDGASSRAGRGFGPLQVGETLNLTIDNPTARHFFEGYIVRLSSGGGNICYAGSPCTTGTTPKERVSFYTFEYFSYGNWKVGDLTSGSHSTTLFDTDTAAAGAKLSFTLTGPESYLLNVHPLGGAGDYTTTGALSNTGSGPINWVEFDFFNNATNPNQATDFYVSNMQVVPEPATFSLLVVSSALAAGFSGRRSKRE